MGRNLHSVIYWRLIDSANLPAHNGVVGDALTFCPKAGWRPALAESLAISSELGMRPLMERVLSRREILGA